MWKLLCVVTLVSFVCGKKEKTFINLGSFVCPREEKALGRCLKDALNAYIPKLASGVPEYNVPPCEPLLIPSMTIQQATGPVTITSSYTDVSVRGPSNMKIKEVDVDISKHEVVAKIYLPELKMKGRYSMFGRILMLPIEGQGDFTGKYGDIHAVVAITLGRQPREHDTDALKCEDLKVSFHVGTASIHMENLFGSSELSKTMNKFLNENWQELSGELQAPLENALRDFLKPIADHAFGSINADDIFM